MSSTVPDLSVVIPTFNTARMTLRCCRAVLETMPAGTEVIVVDDASSDDTATLLADFARVIRLDTNRGFAGAANAGVRAAGGRVVLVLNSDAIVQSGALDALLRAFADDPRLGVAGGRLLDDDGSPQWSGGRTPTLPWMIGVVSGAGHLAGLLRRGAGNAPRQVEWVSGAAIAFRQEVWKTAGPFDERFRFYCQDIELCLRARDASWDVRVVDNAPIVHTLGATIATGSPLRHDPERLWPDLLDWGAAHYGRGWARVARVVLTGVAWLRIIGAKLRGSDTDAFVRAVRALRRT
jgi:GT2 family glycosyltransferase